MKRIIVVAGLLGALAMGTAQARDNTGCGAGTMIWQGQKGIAPQVLAVTTNGTFGNQTFGITFGTLGCTQDGVVGEGKKLSMYTGSNMDRLAQDMSVGHGESLNVLAELMGVEQQDKAAFFELAKLNFSEIFSSEAVTAQDVLNTLQAAMAQDATLSRYVG
ncbi:MAG TPA: DUF3015 domain-containing protein [Gammaproteobacteria bacterium]|nr:DUF3015 domain-containing protein [Gammaproteobacteria bacterium]